MCSHSLSSAWREKRERERKRERGRVRVREREGEEGEKREERETNTDRDKESYLVSLLIKTLILSESGLTLMISFKLNYFLKSSIFKYSHTDG